MFLGAIGRLLGCSWQALASLLLAFELVLLACLSFWQLLADVDTISYELTLQTRGPYFQTYGFTIGKPTYT